MRRGLLFGLSSSLIIGIIAVWTGALPVQTIAAEEQRREPILIPGIQEPEEMRVEPFPVNNVVLTAPELMLGEAMENFDKSDLAALLPALNQILAKYPDFSDGHIMRAAVLCEGNDRVAIMADRDRALKFIDTSRTGKDSIGSLLSMQAKMEYANEDYAAAINDLDRGIRADLKKATKFTNSGAAKPEKTASVCVWTEPDMDALVQRFPTDYRSYLFRGLYLCSFAPLNEESLKPAIENLSKAAELNAKSALPQLFKAEILDDPLVFYIRLDQLGWGDAERDILDYGLLREYEKALSLDPNLLPALSGRALAHFHLKHFQNAIADYDKILSLNPQDATTYNDRGLAKMQLGRSYEAISDFSVALNNYRLAPVGSCF
jgi:tetratricopeptide (TPR) repeat protein